MLNTFAPILIATGRIGLASLFLLGGLNKILNYAVTLESMRDAGLEPAPVLLPLTILLELGGGALIALGRWLVLPAGIALALFTLATNVFFHDFWTMEGDRAALELSLFFKNVSIAGGLLLIAGLAAKDQAR
jgi:putative oxidoreductase